MFRYENRINLFCFLQEIESQNSFPTRRSSDLVVEAGDEQRMKLHLAAVIVNNFVNHLYAMAEMYCKKEGLDFYLLLPLRSEEHTSELKSHVNLVCRLLLEKKNIVTSITLIEK